MLETVANGMQIPKSAGKPLKKNLCNPLCPLWLDFFFRLVQVNNMEEN